MESVKLSIALEVRTVPLPRMNRRRASQEIMMRHGRASARDRYNCDTV